MTVSIGAFTTGTLTAQPFGYEGDSRQGLTARRWQVSGLLTKAEWASLVSVYDTWRGLRIQDADTLSSGVVGTTVQFTGTGYGQTWATIACWFSQPPSAEQTGAYVSASCELVDATQALEVLLREQEKARQSQEALVPDLGTIVLGGVTLRPLAPIDGYRDNPQAQLTAAGRHYWTGPLGITKTRLVRSYCTAAELATLQAWYEGQAALPPAPAVWYPENITTTGAEVVIDGGAKATRYTVEIPLVLTR